MAPALKPRNSKTSDEELKYYQDILQSMPNIVYLLDKNCTLTGGNKNLFDLLDLKDSKEILSNSFYSMLHTKNNWSKERVEMFKRDDISVLLSEKPVYDAEETPVVNEKNEIIYFKSSRIPLFNNKKQVIGLVGILTDISEMKKLTNQINKIKNQLQAYNAIPKEEATVAKKNKQIKRPPKVLMVEDNTAAQKAAQALLMQLDCHVDIAESGEMAKDLFKPGKYDLVFMDIGLKDTSGYVVSKNIRQIEKNTKHHVPIIALTGYEADIVKYDCDDYMMEGALTKPLTSEQAKQIIQHYVYHIDIPIKGLKSIKEDLDH